MVAMSDFILMDGGYGLLWTLKYNETTESTRLKDSNPQYWKIHASFFRDGTDIPTASVLIYQTTENLNEMS
jgi:hypothetical protein